MEHLVRMQRCIDFIEAHVHDDIRAEDVAALSGYSAFHFYRMFSAIVGMPLMEFIRRRKIAYATVQLTTGRTVLDIALEYGFETHAGFTRAFRRIYGLAPERFRLHACSKPPERVDLARLIRYKVIGGTIMQPKISTLPAFTVAGYALETTCEGEENSKAIPAFWQDYMNSSRMNVLHKEIAPIRHDEYGICFAVDPASGKFIYFIGVEVADTTALPAELQTRVVPTATYAVFSTPRVNRPEFVNAIQNTWNFIYNEWLPSSGYEYAEGCADFERYGDACMGNENLTIDIYIPIVKRAD